MDYLEDIKAKKQAIAAKAASKEGIDSLIDELKQIQLASLMAGSSKNTVILADSTDLGDKVAELGDKIIKVLDAFKDDTAAADKLARISADFKQLHAGIAKLSTQQADRADKSLTKVIGAIERLKFPQPVVRVQERPLDFSPLRDMLEPSGIDLNGYRAQDINNADDGVQYIGFLNPEGNWYIVENKVKENTLRYVFGRDGYSEAFSKAGRYEYKLLSEAVNAL